MPEDEPIVDDNKNDDTGTDTPDPRDTQIENLRKALRQERDQIKKLKTARPSTDELPPNIKAELENLRAAAEDYESFLGDQVEAAKSKLPAEALRLFPESAPARAQFEWVNNALEVFSQRAPEPKEKAKPTPTPKGIVNPGGKAGQPTISKEEFEKLPPYEAVKYLDQFITRGIGGKILKDNS